MSRNANIVAFILVLLTFITAIECIRSINKKPRDGSFIDSIGKRFYTARELDGLNPVMARLRSPGSQLRDRTPLVRDPARFLAYKWAQVVRHE